MTIATQNPRFAEGIQYREYVEDVYAKAREAKRERLQKEGKTPKEIEMDMRVSSIEDWPDVDRPRDLDCWGPWQYIKSNLTLIYAPRDNHWHYEIDLERCSRSSYTLDYIFQVRSKSESLVSAEDVGYFIAALDDLLCPQANICSFGQNLTLDIAKYLLEQIPNRPFDTAQIEKAFEEGRITITTIGKEAQ